MTKYKNLETMVEIVSLAIVRQETEEAFSDDLHVLPNAGQPALFLRKSLLK